LRTQGKYIPLTEEQKHRAKNTDLVHFLEGRSVPLKRSASEYCWDRSKEGLGKITIRGNKWFDQYERIGNNSAIDFVVRYFDTDFPTAVQMLTGEAPAVVPVSAGNARPPKLFALPERNDDMRRVYAYLMQKRKISREIISYFTHAKMLYEDAKYHNAVFIGYDEQGQPRHAHKRGTYTDSAFKGNVEGSRPQYSFHHLGSGDQLYVFEAPIDLLAYLSLHPQNWQGHSYVALCSVAAQGMEHILKHNPHMHTVMICLDHDPVGIESAHRLKEIAEGLGRSAELLHSEHKDFGEDIRAAHGETPKPAGEHKGMERIRGLCDDISGRYKKQLQPVYTLEALVKRLYNIMPADPARKHERSLEAAGVAFSYARDLCRRIRLPVNDDALADKLFDRYQPHKDKGALRRRMEEIGAALQVIKSGTDPRKIYTESEIRQQIENALELSMDCLRLSVYVLPEPEPEQSMQLRM